MKTAADYAIDEIRDYIYHVEEMGSWYGLNFEEISFSKWAAMEIINRLKNRDTPPLMIVESFKEEMYMYACSNKKTEEIFSIAVDVADAIDALLITSC
jgi:hypothetical protein